MDDKTKKNNLLKTTISIGTIILIVVTFVIDIAIEFPEVMPDFPRNIPIAVYLSMGVLVLGIIAFMVADKRSS